MGVLFAFLAPSVIVRYCNWELLLWARGFQSMFPGPAVSVLPENILKMQIFIPTSYLLHQEL